MWVSIRIGWCRICWGDFEGFWLGILVVEKEDGRWGESYCREIDFLFVVLGKFIVGGVYRELFKDLLSIC